MRPETLSTVSSLKAQYILSHFFFTFDVLHSVLLLVFDLVSVEDNDDSFFLSLASLAAALPSLFVRCWALR